MRNWTLALVTTNTTLFGRGTGNSRNAKGKNTVKTKTGEMEIETPRDRNATFSPELIMKGQRRFNGFDNKIMSLYARGMKVRETQGHLKKLS